MSPAERQLPQFCHRCANHRYGGQGRNPAEGLFLNCHGRHVWRCYECCSELTYGSRHSPIEREIETVLKAAGVRYVAGYRIGQWYFDFAFRRRRILLEIDSWTYHHGWRRQVTDHSKDQAAAQAGWQLCRLRAERGLGYKVLSTIVHTGSVK
jgi:very-short-patch-repair endonuclease